jgi:hypothetical protein
MLICQHLCQEKMGRTTGSEPATSGTTNRRSNQLSYDRHNPDWQAIALNDWDYATSSG